MSASSQRLSLAYWGYVLLSLASLFLGVWWFLDGATQEVIARSEDWGRKSLAFGQLQLSLVCLGIFLTQLIFTSRVLIRRLENRWLGVTTKVLCVIALAAFACIGLLGLIGGIGIERGEVFPWWSWVMLTLVWGAPFLAIAVGVATVWLVHAGRPRARFGLAVSFLAIFPFLLFVNVLR